MPDPGLAASTTSWNVPAHSGAPGRSKLKHPRNRCLTVGLFAGGFFLADCAMSWT